LKSLVSPQTRDALVRYRLLETTRAYASVKLAESGEADTIARRHAAHFVRICVDDCSTEPFTGAAHRLRMRTSGNVRAAFDWCFSPRGDHEIGYDLVLAVVPLFLHLSLLAECCCLSERALAVLPEADKGTERELALLESRAISSMFTQGDNESVRAAIQRGLKSRLSCALVLGSYGSWLG